jgi:hypothetical protein
MDLSHIEDLVMQYECALKDEYRLRRDAEAEEDAYDQLEGLIINDGYVNGVIDGKNKQTRDAQEAALIADSDALRDAREEVEQLQRQAERMTAKRKALEAEIGLTRAWLYSQASIG